MSNKIYYASSKFQLSYNDSNLIIKSHEKKLKIVDSVNFAIFSNNCLSDELFYDNMRKLFRNSAIFQKYVNFCHQEDSCWVFDNPNDFSLLLRDILENQEYFNFGENLKKLLIENEMEYEKLKNCEEYIKNEFFQYVKVSIYI